MLSASHETRSQAVIRHLEQHQRATGLSWPTLAHDIATAYHALVPPMKRSIVFHTEGDPYDCMRANAQILRRIREGEVRFPADLEEAVVEALPGPAREALLRDLAGRYGLLPVPMPRLDALEDQHSLADFWRETGEAAEAVLAMIRDDGRIGPEDMDKADLTLAELDDVIAVAAGIKAKILHVRGLES